MSNQKRLGRGLAALLGNIEGGPEGEAPPQEHGEHGHPGDRHPDGPHDPPHEHHGFTPENQGGDNGILLLAVHEIDENPFQPRRKFSEPEIASLSESLKTHDMLQPLLVRRTGDRCQLISGERRLRAAIRAGWTHVPVQVREADDRLVAELAIVENLQREDLNAIEKARSFKRYLDQHGCTQEDLARRIKVDRSTIANLMRLLELPEAVQHDLCEGRLTAGHARALLPLGDETQQIAFAGRIREESLSVRATEQAVAEHIAAEDAEPLSVVGDDGVTRKVKGKPKNEQIAALELELRQALGTKVDLKEGAKGKGRITIHFTSHEEFERIKGLIVSEGGMRQRKAA